MTTQNQSLATRGGNSLANEREPKDQVPIQYAVDGSEVNLSVAYAIRKFCPRANSVEAYAFIEFCRYHQLNPFVNDAYLVKYQDNQAAQIVIGYHVWMQRAQLDPNYLGFKAGVVLVIDDEVKYRDGTIYRPDRETLIGGWCEINIEGRDSYRAEVNLHEYNRNQSLWKSHPATMIQKVAIGQCHRFAYPSLFAGMYEQSEVVPGQALPVEPMIIDAPAPALDSAPEVSTEPEYVPEYVPESGLDAGPEYGNGVSQDDINDLFGNPASHRRYEH